MAGHRPPQAQVVYREESGLGCKSKPRSQKVFESFIASFVVLAIITILMGGMGVMGTAKGIVVVCIFSVVSASLTLTQSLISIPDKQIENFTGDVNSPQARFARDEISPLELEQEIERQLDAGLSGAESMFPDIRKTHNLTGDGTYIFNDLTANGKIVPLNGHYCQICNSKSVIRHHPHHKGIAGGSYFGFKKSGKIGTKRGWG